MVIKLKEAGFEVGFSPCYWTFASGFPKSMNIEKHILKDISDIIKEQYDIDVEWEE
jgi:hypothetical protein